MPVLTVSPRFWDWTKPDTAKEGIPKLLKDPNATITNPGGSQSRVSNPLNHYRFTLKPGVSAGSEYMANWDRTYRWANNVVQPTQELYDQALK